VEPKGTLRVTCGVTFGERYLAPAIAEFAGLHPQVSFDVDLSDRVGTWWKRGSISRSASGRGNQALGVAAHRQYQFVCCASPAYLARHPRRDARGLEQHACLGYTYAR